MLFRRWSSAQKCSCWIQTLRCEKPTSIWWIHWCRVRPQIGICQNNDFSTLQYSLTTCFLTKRTTTWRDENLNLNNKPEILSFFHHNGNHWVLIHILDQKPSEENQYLYKITVQNLHAPYTQLPHYKVFLPLFTPNRSSTLSTQIQMMVSKDLSHSSCTVSTLPTNLRRLNHLICYSTGRYKDFSESRMWLTEHIKKEHDPSGRHPQLWSFCTGERLLPYAGRRAGI